jgi:quercetin dioxygenase-like cupin family protein
MRSKKWIAALLAGALGSAVAAGTVHATPPGPDVQTIQLAKATFAQLLLTGRSTPPGLWHARIATRGLSDLYVVDNKIPAGETTGWHSHPGPSLIFVVAGTVTNLIGDGSRCTGQLYAAGSGFVDPGGNDVHEVRNDTDAPAETIAVQFLPKDATRRIDEPAPSRCHS